MKITEIKFRMSEDSGLLAWASCVLEDGMFLNNIAIRKKYDGSIYLNFPRYKSGSGNEYAYFKPINAEVYQEIKTALLNALGVDDE